MTEITYKRKNDVVRITIDGHAGFRHGNDPVCAGISAITYQLINSLSIFEGKVKDVVNCITDGRAIITFRVEDEGTWDTIWTVVQTGYMAIAIKYPDNLRLVGVNDCESCDK